MLVQLNRKKSDQYCSSDMKEMYAEYARMRVCSHNPNHHDKLIPRLQSARDPCTVATTVSRSIISSSEFSLATGELVGDIFFAFDTSGEEWMVSSLPRCSIVCAG